MRRCEFLTVTFLDVSDMLTYLILYFQAYAQQRLTPWIRRIKLRRKSGDQCLKMTWGEVKFADHIRNLQLARGDLPPQPTFIRQHLLHHDVQRTVLGESPYISADLML